MTTIREGQFYRTWVRYGKNISQQWGEVRQNFREIHPHGVNEQIDVTSSTKLPALAGQAWGKQDFRNKWRVYYDQDNTSFKVQVNKGTVDSPTWTDYIQIDDNIGKVIFTGEGGIDSSAGGFYGIVHPQELEKVGEAGAGAGTIYNNVSKLFFNVESGFYLTKLGGANSGATLVNTTQSFGRAKEFSLTSNVEWQVTHNFNYTPVVTAVYDTTDRLIQQSEINLIDVSDPNTAYFYFTSAKAGKAIIFTGSVGVATLRPADPFYLVVKRVSDEGTVFHNEAKIIFEDGQFYVNVDSNKNEAFISLQPVGPTVLSELDDVSSTAPSDNQVLTFDSATQTWGPEAGGGGTGIDVKDGTNTYNSADELNVNNSEFYLTSDAGGKPVVNLQPNLTLGIVTAQVEFDTEQYIDFTEADEPSTPDADHLRMWAEDHQGKSVLHFKGNDDIVYEMGRDLTQIVRNTSGGAISKGELVYISGSTGAVPTVSKAKADSATTMPAFGFASEAMANNAFGRVTRQGDIENIDTSAFSAGDLLFVSADTAGAFTTSRPGLANKLQRVGVVLASGAGNGLVAVNIVDEDLNVNTNNFYLSSDAGGESVLNLAADLSDLDDVSTTAPSDNDVLIFDAATSLWGPEPIAITFKNSIVSYVDDTVHFNEDHFYITVGGTGGEPVINFNSAAPGRFSSRQGVLQKGYELSSATLTLDFTASNVHEVVLNQNVTTVNITNTGNVPATHIVKFTQDATGGRTVSGWAAAVKWTSASGVPTITSAANAVDVISFYADSEGNIYGNIAQDFT